MQAAANWPALPGLDMVAARACCGDNLDLFGRLLTLLQKNYGDWTAVWLDAASSGAPTINQDLCASLHKLRGGAATMGATRLAVVAGQFEASLKEGQVLPLEAVQHVGEELDQLLVQVDRWQARGRANGG